MKYIKTFESFIAERLIAESSDGIESLKKMVKDYFDLCAKELKMYYDVHEQTQVLRFQIIEAKNKGKDQEAEKLEKQQKALVDKRDEYDSIREEREKMEKDALENLDPKAKKALSTVRREYGGIFDSIRGAAKGQVASNEVPNIIAALKKINRQDFTESQEEYLDRYLSKMNTEAKSLDEKSYTARVEKMVARAEEILSKKESKKKGEKITKNDVEDLLDVKAEKISVSPDEISVVVSGNELGYDDDQYYDTTWYISDKRVETGVYADSKLKKQITADILDGEVDSLKAFVSIVNNQ